MMVAPALALGVKLRILCSAADQSAALVIPDVVLGNYRDPSTMREFAKTCDVLTLIDESIPPGLIRSFEADDIRMRPSAESLIYSLDRANLRDALAISMDKVDTFDLEISVLVARSPHNQAALWAVTEISKETEFGRATTTTAPGLNASLAGQAQRIALEIAGSVKLVGVMSVQMYVVGDQLVVGQIAFGPHASGNWTIDGSVTCQFEQHLRAILDLPLGSTDLLAPFAVTADVFGTDKTDQYRPYLHVFARDPGVKVHQYGQEVRPGHKSGHVTVIGDNALDLRQRAAHAAEYISGVIDE